MSLKTFSSSLAPPFPKPRGAAWSSAFRRLYSSDMVVNGFKGNLPVAWDPADARDVENLDTRITKLSGGDFMMGEPHVVETWTISKFPPLVLSVPVLTVFAFLGVDPEIKAEEIYLLGAAKICNIHGHKAGIIGPQGFEGFIHSLMGGVFVGVDMVKFNFRPGTNRTTPFHKMLVGGEIRNAGIAELLTAIEHPASVHGYYTVTRRMEERIVDPEDVAFSFETFEI